MQFLTFATAVLASAVSAQGAPQPCTGPEYSQMDFWVGDWTLKWNGGAGTSRIAKDYGGCAIGEFFDSHSAPPLHSVSAYSKGQWRQSWVDNQGRHFDLAGGPQADGSFVLETVHVSDKTLYRRMVFENIKPDSLTWRWQASDDRGKTWSDRWVVEYRRAKS
jgi:hypothetical protein